ncbi:hypothetical protein [Bosea sp. PAMC 26642]|uniref:hypothetical protein n=1 Tax=Bosea sp. (strain PAMC 26642) TaxID=1792307 RepID=UPI00077023F0|nr:hypothetical protein [Bosea sp. PAMC 26642]AMJ61282.1 hypothetical protein AXW83_14120 [Bosea sp. PAMC 26642]
MAYTNELEPLLDREQTLRQAIALRIAEESGEEAAAPAEIHIKAAQEAIEAWIEESEWDQDTRAFRPQTPLQTLLAEHHAICERILDLRDRRLS